MNHGNVGDYSGMFGGYSNLLQSGRSVAIGGGNKLYDNIFNQH